MINNSAKLAGATAVVALSVIAAIGVLGLVFVIPATAQELARTYSEYAGDRNTIQLLLSVPTAITIVIFGEIIYLLVLVSRGKMLSFSTFKWVRLLGYSAAILAVSFVGLFGYLNYKNTLPPSIALAICVLMLFSAAVSLVTFSLLGLLKSATEAKLDLDGVI